MSDESSYFVVLNRIDHFNIPVLADILSRILAIHCMDATTQLKRAWGFLYKTDVIEEAEKLQLAFQKAAIETFVLPDSELKKPPQLRTTKKAVPGIDGLAFQDEEHDKLLPWSSVILLCAGEVEEITRETERLPPDGKAKKWLLRTGLSPITAVAIQYERSKIREVTEDRIESSRYLDLIAKDDYDSVRILTDSFDYSYLGSKMAYSANLNFKNLALDIAKSLTHVTKNQGMRTMETQSVIKAFKYSSLDDFENEKLWLMQLKPD